jgi:ubiquitin C-terminal hydrolase
MDLNKITGLINMGNTCFLNSAMQLIMNCPLLVTMILNNNFEDENMNKYKKTFEDYFNENTKRLGPKILYKRYQLLNKNYTGLTQEDSHEYLTFIIDDITELSKHKSEIKELFEIILDDNIKCTECGYTTSVKINDNILSLTPQDCNNLQQCIEKILKKELINDWKCDRCNKKVNSIKNSSFNKLPKYFFIYINRFIYHNSNIAKDNVLIDIPIELQSENIEPAQVFNYYYLTGIIFHYGNTNGGHYFSALKKEDKWFIIDDTDVREAQWDNIKQLLQYTYVILYSH